MTAVAVLGLALSGCGGGSSGSAATAQSAQNSIPAQSSAPAQSSGQSASTGSTSGSSSSGATVGVPPTASSNSVTINWMPPTENTDGSTLTNLSGYNIHYGTATHSYTQVVAISNPGLARYVVSNLTPGKYYFAVAAVNSAGTESPLSSEVSATVN